MLRNLGPVNLGFLFTALRWSHADWEFVCNTPFIATCTYSHMHIHRCTCKYRHGAYADWVKTVLVRRFGLGFALPITVPCFVLQDLTKQSKFRLHCKFPPTASETRRTIQTNSLALISVLKSFYDSFCISFMQIKNNLFHVTAQKSNSLCVWLSFIFMPQRCSLARGPWHKWESDLISPEMPLTLQHSDEFGL